MKWNSKVRLTRSVHWTGSFRGGRSTTSSRSIDGWTRGSLSNWCGIGHLHARGWAGSHNSSGASGLNGGHCCRFLVTALTSLLLILTALHFPHFFTRHSNWSARSRSSARCRREGFRRGMTRRGRPFEWVTTLLHLCRKIGNMIKREGNKKRHDQIVCLGLLLSRKNKDFH